MNNTDVMLTLRYLVFSQIHLLEEAIALQCIQRLSATTPGEWIRIW
jgi:hypothetical protein